MSIILQYFIPLFCGVYFLLIINGVIKLSPEKQIKFDEYIGKRRRLFITLSYFLILFSIILAIHDLSVSK